MQRRDFIKLTGSAFLLANAPRFSLANTGDTFTGDFVVQIQVFGAWDVASYCDPKVNTATRIINNWATTLSPLKAGNIAYAPFANNAEFFPKHFDKMLVINGVHGYTNGHDAGTLNATRGIINRAYPSLSAAYAGTVKNQFAVPVIKNGGAFATAGLVSAASLGTTNINAFKGVLHPGERPEDGKVFFESEDKALIDGFRAARADRLLDITSAEERKALLESFILANRDNPAFNRYMEIFDSIDYGTYNTSSSFIKKITYGLVAFKAGLTAALDVPIGNFDTHSNHDIEHAELMTELNNGLDYMWFLAEQLGIKDRIFTYIASDFGRTPNYNSGGGKDHHAVGSIVIMKDNVSWTNRVIGETTDVLKAQRINKETLLVDDQNGTIIEPAHVMQFARDYLGIGDHESLARFPLRIEGGNFQFI